MKKNIIIKKAPAKRMAAKKADAPAGAGMTLKEKLAAGAAALKKAKAEEAAAKPKLTAREKATGKEVAVIVETVKAVVPTKGDIEDILSSRVTMSKDKSSLTIDKDTPAGEYIRIFDYFAALGEKVQFLLGDAINAGENILGEKYAAVMAASGRPLGQLKQYAYVARHIPAALRNQPPALTYSHIAAVAAVPLLEDKKAILDAAKNAANDGHPMTKAEVMALAKAKTPADPAKKKKGPKPGSKQNKTAKKDGNGAQPPLEMNAGQAAMYDDILEKARTLEEAITGPNAEPLRAFIFKIKYADKKTLLDSLKPTGMLANNLEKYLGYAN